jgi:hypothetical protein
MQGLRTATDGGAEDDPSRRRSDAEGAGDIEVVPLDDSALQKRVAGRGREVMAEIGASPRMSASVFSVL